MEINPPQRLYLIQNTEYDYHAGLLENGRQVLMDRSSRVEFDGAGDVVAVFSHEAVSTTMKALDAEGNVLAAFVQEAPEEPSLILPFTPGTISVKPFFLPELWLGIRDLPDHYQDFVDHPENATEDERFYYPDEIDAWRECGDFVLWWNKDYFLNTEGELESS